MCVKLVRCDPPPPGSPPCRPSLPRQLTLARSRKGDLDRLTEAATGGRDDRGDADVSGDTDRDPEADVPSAYRGTS